jgi:hypothetical protein
VRTIAPPLVCAACGYEPEWTRDDWGRHPETHGVGPDPVCSALVEDTRFTMPDGTHPGMICRGTLVPRPSKGGKRETA